MQHKKLFEALYESCDTGRINIRPLPSGKNEFFELGEDISDCLKRHSGESLYFAVALRNGGATKEHITQIPAVWCDCDFKDISAEKLRKKVREFPFKPSAIVHSGGGVHLYWILKEPAEKSDIPTIENINKRIMSVLGGDPKAVDASRILRIPGTVNRKPERNGAICELKEINAFRYSLDDFDVLPEITEEKPKVKKILKGVPKGERDDSLFKYACRLRSLNTDYDEAEVLILKAASECKPPMPEREAIKCLKSAWKKPAGKSDNILNYLYQNEDGDAALYVKLFKGKICYDHAANEWYQWQGNFWAVDKVGNYLAQTTAVIELYQSELPNQKENPVATEDLKKRIKALQTLKRKKSILELARSGENSLGMSGDEWDSDGMVLACKNAVIDLKTGQARPGKPSDYIRKHCNANWQGLNHVSELWEKFHSDVIGDADTIEFNQRLLGYGITGGTQYHILPIYWGTGRNGKGTLVETIAHVMGQYAMKTRSESLIDDPKGMKQSHDADKVSLKGRRLVWASETEDGCKLSTARVKELVGGDTLSARSPYGKRPVDFVPTHKLFLLTNHLPHIQPNDLAIWERVRKIEFNKNFLDNNPDTDHDLPEKLKDEADGILSWLVRGCLKFQADGLRAPESVLAATKQYRKKEDLIEQFLEECCIRKPDTLIKSGNLHAAYKAWCEADGTKATNNKKFKDELILKGFETHHDGRNSWIK